MFKAKIVNGGIRSRKKSVQGGNRSWRETVHKCLGVENRSKSESIQGGTLFKYVQGGNLFN
jgi:hypothetical protein